MDEMNLDYKQMYENLQKLTAEKFKQEQCYFDLLCKVNSMNPYADKVSKVLTTLPMADQIKVLQCIAQYQEVCKALVEKHSLCDENDNE